MKREGWFIQEPTQVVPPIDPEVFISPPSTRSLSIPSAFLSLH
jgi:hypothetical protein